MIYNLREHKGSRKATVESIAEIFEVDWVKEKCAYNIVLTKWGDNSFIVGGIDKHYIVATLEEKK